MFARIKRIGIWKSDYCIHCYKRLPWKSFNFIPALHKTMASYRRISMNTSLKDARIFEDICDDATDFDFNSLRTNNVERTSLEIQQPSKFEIIPKLVAMMKQDNHSDVHIKTLDPFGNLSENTSKYPEPSCSYQDVGNKTYEIDYFRNMKREICDEDSVQEAKEDYFTSTKKIKLETMDESTNEELSRDYKNRKFKPFKKSLYTRRSPYQRPTTEFAPEAEKINQCVKNLALEKHRVSDDYECESDANVLARRQKQIDFGKNTIGYDNYVRTVPRFKRKRGEPSTPDKYKKYSRRGWDALIKHWRLQLHNYD